MLQEQSRQSTFVQCNILYDLAMFSCWLFFFCLNFEKQNKLSSVLHTILMMSFSTARKLHFKFNSNQHTFVPPPSCLQNKNIPCYRAHSRPPCNSISGLQFPAVHSAVTRYSSVLQNLTKVSKVLRIPNIILPPNRSQRGSKHLPVK